MQHMTVADLLTDAAADHPDKVALVEADGRARTWHELDDEVSRVASGLAHAGVIAGFRVMIATGNRIEFVASYLGVLRAQAVAVPVNPRSTVEELTRMIADSGSKVVLADVDTVSNCREAIAAVGAGTRLYVIGGTLNPGERSYDHLMAMPPTPSPQRRDREALATLLYTSGTSGRPRAAMLSHRALLANIEQVGAVDPQMISADDVVLGVLPMFHVYGLNAVLGNVLRQQAKLVLMPRFDPQGALDLIEDEACSVVPVAPAVFGHWLPIEHLDERLGPVRLVLSGSAPLSPEVLQQFEAASGVPVHQGYGLTEAAPVVTSTLCSSNPAPTSVGAALPGIRIKLVAEGGAPPEGEDAGEIHIAGDNLFSGYWPDGADGPDADGWWATGDVGFLDAQGDLYLVDRLKELVIVSGFNVYPSEIEDLIGEVEGVGSVAVIGVPDERTGEAVVAYVTGRGPGDATDLLERVTARCRERLARFKQPSRIEIVDELPLTVTGKVQKGRLRAVERRRALSILEG